MVYRYPRYRFWVCWWLMLWLVVAGAEPAAAQQPQLVLPIGHTLPVRSVQFSPDGLLVLTASSDNSAKLWDASSGKLLHSLDGHGSKLYEAQFSPDGHRLVTASADYSAKVWDTRLGKLLLDLNAHTRDVLTAQFSPSNKTIATGSADKTARLWEATTGKLLLTLTGHADAVTSVRFSADGKTLVTASDDRTAKLWDVATGKLLLTLAGHGDALTSAQFSPDKKTVLTTSADRTARLWDAATGHLLHTLRGHTDVVMQAQFAPGGSQVTTASADRTALIWDIATGKELHRLPGHAGGIFAVAYQPGGKTLVTAAADSVVRVWETATGRLLHTLRGHRDWVLAAAYSRDGKKLISGSYDHTACVWNADTGELLARLEGHTQLITSGRFAPDGQTVHVSSWDRTVQCWNSGTGELFRKLTGHTNVVAGQQISPDQQRLLSFSVDNTARVWNPQTGTPLLRLAGHGKQLSTAQFSPNGLEILTASADSTAAVWDAQTGRRKVVLRGHTGAVTAAAFSPQGTSIVTASADHTALLWHAPTGKLVQRLVHHTGPLVSACFSADGHTVVTASTDRTALVWNATTGKLLLTLAGHQGPLTSAQFSPDQRLIVTTSEDRTAKVWQAQTGKLLASLEGHAAWVSGVRFSPDGKRLLTISWGSVRFWDVATWQPIRTLKLYNGVNTQFEDIDFNQNILIGSRYSELVFFDAQTGQQLYSLLSVNEHDWLAIDPDGRYDGTEGARKLLYFTCGTEVIQLDQVKDQLWVPGLVERIRKKETIGASKLLDLNLCGLTPEVAEQRVAGGYRFVIKPRRGGLGETVLLVNNIEVRRYKAAQLKKLPAGYELLISREQVQSYFIGGRPNKVTVKSFTASNDIASRGAEIVQQETASAAAPNLYAVLVGVSDYKGTELDLHYAAKDAQDLGRALSAAAGKLLNADGRQHVFLYRLNTGPDRDQLPEKRAIRATLEEIGKKATANDILLIFFAGHGVMETHKKQFYFLTADASQATATDAPATVGISSQELVEWIRPERVKAQKRILMFDACNSGQVIDDLVRIGNPNQQYVAARNDDRSQQIKAIEKLNERAGLFILSASASNQSAYEMGRYAQGLLTYTLLQAMQGRPDVLEEGRYLNVSRWFNAARESVGELVRASGNRQQPQVVSTSNFNLGIIDEDVRAAIVLPGPNTMFVGCTFQNADDTVLADDLELGIALDQYLTTLSSRDDAAAIGYLGHTLAADAYAISGRYQLHGQVVKAHIVLRRGKIPVQRFEVSGTTDNLPALVRSIAEHAVQLISQAAK